MIMIARVINILASILGAPLRIQANDHSLNPKPYNSPQNPFSPTPARLSGFEHGMNHPRLYGFPDLGLGFTAQGQEWSITWRQMDMESKMETRLVLLSRFPCNTFITRVPFSYYSASIRRPKKKEKGYYWGT